MTRIALWAAGAVVAVAAVILLLRLRSGPAEPPATAPAPPAAKTAPAKPAPLPPEIERRRPAIPTRPREQAVKPKVSNTIAKPEVAGDAADVVRQASDAYAKERYSEALEQAERALEIDRSSALARSLAVLSACGLGRADRAVEHAAVLDERRRQPLIARCHAEYGLELEVP